jgi:hypothetical protein
MKAYLVHKRGYVDRFGGVIANLYNSHSLEAVEIIFVETSDLKFPEVRNVSIQEWAETYLKSEIPSFGPLTNPEKSLFHKHYVAFSRIAELGIPSIVFEDDALFLPNDLDKFVGRIDSIPSGWDVVFFGTGCGLRADGDGFVRQIGNLKSKCTDSMLISPEAASRIVRDWDMTGAVLPVDWDLNVRFNRLNLRVYWFEPAFVTQGSQNGKFASEIQAIRGA